MSLDSAFRVFCPHSIGFTETKFARRMAEESAEASVAGLLGWEEDLDLSDGDDDQDGSSAALYAMEHRRSLNIEMEELREQELANYEQTVNADVDRQTMHLLKEVESTPTAKEQALRNKINVGLKTVMGLGSWRRKAKKRETTHEELVRLQKEELDAKWAQVQEANRLRQAMMVAMRDKAQLGPLFCVELAYELVYEACDHSERKRYLATCMVNRWRGALCRRAYRNTRLVNTALTQRHRARRPSSLRLQLTFPTPSLRLATTPTAFFRTVVAHVVPVPKSDRAALAQALGARVTRRDIAELRWCAAATQQTLALPLIPTLTLPWP